MFLGKITIFKFTSHLLTYVTRFTYEIEVY